MRIRTLFVVLTLLIATGASLLTYLHFNPDIETAWYMGGRLEKSEDGTPFICTDGVAYVKIKESGSAQLWATQPDSKSEDGQKHCAQKNYRSVIATSTIDQDSFDGAVIDPIQHCRYYGTLSKTESKPSGACGFLECLGAKVMEIAGAPPLYAWTLNIKYRRCDSEPVMTEASTGSVPLGPLLKPVPAGAPLVLMETPSL